FSLSLFLVVFFFFFFFFFSSPATLCRCVLIPVLIRVVICRRGRRVQLLLVGCICAIARACHGAPEDKEPKSVHPCLRNPDEKGDQEQHHVGEHHAVLEAALPALGVQALPGGRPCPGRGPGRAGLGSPAFPGWCRPAPGRSRATCPGRCRAACPGRRHA